MKVYSTLIYIIKCLTDQYIVSVMTDLCHSTGFNFHFLISRR
jgi:hypothetical protein